MKVMVLAPHADDESLGCGGTIARHVDSGDSVHVAILTNASVGAPDLFSAEAVDEIRAESRAALKVLGSEPPHFLELPAPQLDQYPEFELAQQISLLLARWDPEVVYLPFEGDLHVDHSAVARAGLVAMRPHQGLTLRLIYAYETLSETEWGSRIGHGPFVPNHFVDVSTQMDRKLEALAQYRTQLKPFPHPRSLEAVRALAQFRGATVGVPAAEGFMVIRQVNR